MPCVQNLSQAIHIQGQYVGGESAIQSSPLGPWLRYKMVHCSVHLPCIIALPPNLILNTKSCKIETLSQVKLKISINSLSYFAPFSEAKMVKIFVGNLDEGTTDANKLRSLFEQYGSVSECDVLSKYGFVVCFLLFSVFIGS